MIKAVLFDFDGTLANSEEGIIYTAKKVMALLGVEEHKANKEMRGFIGPMLPDCFRNVFNLKEDKIEEAVNLYRTIYRESGYKMLYLYPGMKESLLELKKQGIKLGVCTNKGQSIIEECLNYLNIYSLFDVIAGSNNSDRKNKAETIDYAVKKIGLNKDEFLMVGDTYNDKDGSDKNSIKFLAALWGFGFEKNDYDKLPFKATDPYQMNILINKENTMIEKINTEKAPKAIGPYSQAVKVDNFIFASGQIPIIPETGNVLEGSAAEQAEQCFKNIKAVLEEGGSDLTKVIKATVFLKDMNDFVSVNEVYAKAFEKAPILPARSAVQVGKLPKDVKVEIEVIALC